MRIVLERAALAALFAFCVPLCAREPVEARHFMVAAAHPLAVEAGTAVLRRGGDAVDAAVAVQAVLGLVEPESSGIGGGAFLLFWSEREKKLFAYDGREAAPAAARPGRFLGPEGKPMAFFDAVVGGRSVGVPGALRMLELAHAKHGRLPWSELFHAAIFAAEEGFALSPRLRLQLEGERFLRNDREARALYYEADGSAKPVGTRIVNKAYGRALRAVATGGADAFYRGDIAADIARAVREGAKPGDLALSDLADYRALEREPLCGPYREWRVCSMPPPSSGGLALLQILGILERTGFARAPAHSAAAVHLVTEAERLAYADRARYVGDPDFVRVPLARLLDSSYLQKRSALIGPRSMGLAAPGDSESPGTSHVSIVDAEGNAVALTTTIENPFGSRIMVDGFLLNNELTDFDFAPGGANQVQAGKRPRSSMAPTLVFDRAGRLQFVIGSPGGPFIIDYVARALIARLDWKLDLQSAVDAPNFGSRNGPTEIERGTPYEALAPQLRALGHEVVLRAMTSGLHAVERAPGGWRGAADRRREGVAAGD
ncbi:MAG TPA: gamma-glutamyltransferase [Burkholderiales bacterium]|nr:gamma-glutamyltransferase [Burkholderiales bacterium]